MTCLRQNSCVCTNPLQQSPDSLSKWSQFQNVQLLRCHCQQVVGPETCEEGDTLVHAHTRVRTQARTRTHTHARTHTHTRRQGYRCTHLPGLGANAISLTGPYTPTRFCSLCHFLHRQTDRHKQTLLPRSPHCLTHSLSHHLTLPQPHHLTHSLSYHLTLPRPHHLTHSLSHHLTLPTHLACSLCSNTCTAEVCACGSSLPTTIIEG